MNNDTSTKKVVGRSLLIKGCIILKEIWNKIQQWHTQPGRNLLPYSSLYRQGLEIIFAVWILPSTLVNTGGELHKGRLWRNNKIIGHPERSPQWEKNPLMKLGAFLHSVNFFIGSRGSHCPPANMWGAKSFKKHTSYVHYSSWKKCVRIQWCRAICNFTEFHVVPNINTK